MSVLARRDASTSTSTSVSTNTSTSTGRDSMRMLARRDTTPTQIIPIRSSKKTFSATMARLSCAGTTAATATTTTTFAAAAAMTIT